MKVNSMKHVEPASTCPIPGCAHRYQRGSTGWFQHVAKPENHVQWHADVEPPNLRGELFRKEFPAFFAPQNGAVSPSVPPPAPEQQDEVQACLREALELSIKTGDARAIRVVATAIAALAAEPARTVSGVRKVG